MRLLLDTHSFLWFILADPQLSPAARDVVEDLRNEVLISPASYWEIAIKTRLGKVNPGTKHLDQEIAANQFTELAISAATVNPRLIQLALKYIF